MATSRRLASRRYGRRMNVAGWPKRGERKPSRGPIPSTDALEIAAEAAHRGGQAVDVGVGAVDREARPQRSRDAEALHQRLRAVVAGPHRDAALVEQRGAVVG